MGRTHATHEFACSSRERWAQFVGMGEQKYKTVKHYHEPGDLHELTFSCYRRITLLTNTVICEKLARAIDAAGEQYRMPLVGFVFMPEHVHLLVRPLDDQPAIADYLREVKQPVSVLQKQLLIKHKSRLLQRLTIASGSDQGQFRFWQKGPGYDRNLQTCPAVRSSLNYLHENPCRRTLVQAITDWRWSSARYVEREILCIGWREDRHTTSPHHTPACGVLEFRGLLIASEVAWVLPMS